MTTLMANEIFSDNTPILSDRDLEAWGSYYCQEKRIHRTYTFDKFVSEPMRHCHEAGVFPAPHIGNAPDIGDMERNLLQRQRRVMWKMDGFCSARG